MVHNNPTLRQFSIKIVVSVSVLLGFRLALLDVMQAYLQSKQKLTREIYVRPKHEDLNYFGLKHTQLLRLIRLLYGICDSGDYWRSTLSKFAVDKLKLHPLHGYPSLYV